MGHHTAIDTSEAEEYVFFKSNRPSAKACRVASVRPTGGGGAFDAFARKVATLKETQSGMTKRV